MAMKVLATGGAGFIGSHTTVSLLEAGHDVVILDNLSNAKAEVLNRIERITGKQPRQGERDRIDRQQDDRQLEQPPHDHLHHQRSAFILKRYWTSRG